MGYFNSMAASAFKNNPDGEGWLYYPNGSFSKGRLVTDSLYKEKLFKFQQRIYMFLLPVGLLYGLSLDLDNLNLSSLYPIIIVLAPIYLRQYFLIKNLPKSNIKLKPKEAITTAANGLPKYYFYLFHFSSTGLIIIGLSTPFLFNKTYSEVSDLTLMLTGTGLFFLATGIILQRLKKSKST